SSRRQAPREQLPACETGRVRRLLTLGLFAAVLAGCGGGPHPAATPALRTTQPKKVTSHPAQRLVSALRLPLVRSRILPGYLLVADRNNDRVLLLSPSRRIVWRKTGLHEPDDAFFTLGFSGIITNEEFDDTLTQLEL